MEFASGVTECAYESVYVLYLGLCASSFEVEKTI